jgi:hypothetical protein
MKKIIDIKLRDESEIESEYQENLKKLTSGNSEKSYFRRKPKYEIELQAELAIKDYGTCQLSEEFYVSNQYVQHCDFKDCNCYSFVSSNSLTTEKCYIRSYYPSEVLERCKKMNSREVFKDCAKFVGHKIAHPTDDDEHEKLMSILDSKNITKVLFNRGHHRTVVISLNSERTLTFPVKFGYVIFGICDDSKSEQFKDCKMADI